MWPDGTHGKRWIPQCSGDPAAGRSWPDTAPTAAGRWGSHPGLRSRAAPASDSRGRPVLLCAPETEPGRTPRLLRRGKRQNPLVSVQNRKEGGSASLAGGMSPASGRAQPVVPPMNTAQARSRVGSSGPGQGPRAARPAPRRETPGRAAGASRERSPRKIHSTDTFGSDLGVQAPAHESGSERVSREQGRPVGLCCRA